MNKLDLEYQMLLEYILGNGEEKKDRTGTSTLSVFGWQIRHKMSEGFPLLTTKKMAWKTMVTELLWFLRGDTNIKYLVDNNCHIWDGDCYQAYLKKCNTDSNFELYMPYTQEEFINKIKTDDAFAKEWGDLGPIYGAQWRRWKCDTWVEGNTDGTEGFYLQSDYTDQIQNLINELKTNPDSRRLMVNAWNPADLPNMVLPPCHYGFQVYTRELSVNERLSYYCNLIGVYRNPGFELGKSDEYYDSWLENHNIPKRAISLMFNARSQDVPLGTPFNIASYALLLEIIAKMVNMVPDELITNLGDAHIYKNQIDGVKEQLTRTPMKLPNLIISDEMNFNGTIDEFLESCNRDSFKLDGYESHPSIKMPLSN